MITLQNFKFGLNFILSPPVCIVCNQFIELKVKNENNEKFDKYGYYDDNLCKSCYLNIPMIFDYDEIKIDISQNKSKDLGYIDDYYSLVDSNKNRDYFNLVYELKYQKRKIIAKTIGQLLVPLVDKIHKINQYDYLICVPIHNARKRERGFNQSELICEELINHVDIKLNFDLVLRSMNNVSQTSLSTTERMINIKNAFSTNEKNKNSINQIEVKNIKKVLLLDDVLTTGFTVNSIAKKVKNLGIEKVDVVTFIRS